MHPSGLGVFDEIVARPKSSGLCGTYFAAVPVMSFKILFSNLGYAKGIDGSLWAHVKGFGRHFYCRIPIQKTVLTQVKNIIMQEQPDLCCLIEIDQGSFHSAYFNQLQDLIDEEYRFFDISNKYGDQSLLRYLPSHKGNSNAFISKVELPFERFYFSNGTKRLIHRIELPNNRFVFFAHFSLNKAIRAKQFEETNALLRQCTGEVILLADFNILGGFSELKPLLEGTGLSVLNNESDHTFTFHRRRLALDLCIGSKDLLSQMKLKIIPQPFSDHAALLVEL